jgi:hypothetical protein
MMCALPPFGGRVRAPLAFPGPVCVPVGAPMCISVGATVYSQYLTASGLHSGPQSHLPLFSVV